MSKITELTAIATQIKAETVLGANDEARIGGAFDKVVEAIIEEVGTKVTAVAGYGLSENDYSDAEVAKVDGKADKVNLEGNIRLVANLDAQLTNGWWVVSGSVTAAVSIVGGSWVAGTVLVMGDNSETITRQVLTFETSTGTYICTRRKNMGAAWTPWLRVNQDVYDTKQTKLTNNTYVKYYQEIEPPAQTSVSYWIKPSVPTLYVWGEEAPGVFDWGIYPIETSKIYNHIGGGSYIYTGTTMLEMSERSQYYVEDPNTDGIFAIHRGEILSLINALTVGAYGAVFQLEVPLDGAVNIYHLCAKMGAVVSTLAFACTGYTITWAGGSAPTPELSKPFEVSFMETSPTIINAIFKQL